MGGLAADTKKGTIKSAKFSADNRPARTTRAVEIILPPDLRPRLSRGHPWVYRNQVPPGIHLTTGTWVRLKCGNFHAFGLWDEQSPIAIRVFSSQQIPDYTWMQNRVAEAWALRHALRNTAKGMQTNAYRWIFGESDGLPGLTVDLYAEYAVIQTYAAAVEILIPWLSEALRETTSLKGILRRRRATLENVEEQFSAEHLPSVAPGVEMVWGTSPPRELIVLENGLRFAADLRHGQKSGLFLDHRDNRQLIEGLSRGKSVLNCFAYTGAFSVYAARGGAKQLTSLDSSADAIRDAERNFQLNGFDPDAHEFLVADCFSQLAAFKAEKRQFDLIILDPPSFAHSKKNLYAALRGYTKINELALGCLRPGGTLVSASCTSYVSPEAFREMLAGAAQQAGCRILLTHDQGQPLDHPVPAHFLEGRYLKFMVGRVSTPA